MPSCREIAPLVTTYVDDEATPVERALVDAHLQACPPCRRRAAAETAARHTVRTCLCRPCAPDQLRERCRAAARTGPFGAFRMSVVSLSLAAALALVTGGVLVYALTGLSPAVLAAQLTVDHLACFAVHDTDAPIDARAGEDQYASRYGERIRLPRVSAAGLQLVGVKRCYCGEGAVAHVMYRLAGRPVSLYMIPDASRPQAAAGLFGYDAVIWSRSGMTYVLVSREPRAILERIAVSLEPAP